MNTDKPTTGPVDQFGRPLVPCKTCGTLTPMAGTKMCDACWETECRLDDYLRRGGANAHAFVKAALEKARPF